MPDPDKKSPTFKSLRGWGTERTLKEIENCELLCQNCHAIEHSNANGFLSRVA